MSTFLGDNLPSIDSNDNDHLDSMYWYRPQYVRKETDIFLSENPSYSSLPVDADEGITTQHYLGNRAVDNAMIELGINESSPPLKVLDAGGGLGGVGRYMCRKSNNLHVLSFDCNQNFTQLAEEISLSSGLNDRVSHITGDLLDLDNTFDLEKFDGLVSFLCILHIADKATLFKSIARHIKPNGMIYIEDFASSENMSITSEDLSLLKVVVSCSLPMLTVTEYSTLLESTGFTDIKLVDMTKDWTDFTIERAANYSANYDRQCRIHNEAIAKEYLNFYQVTSGLFSRDCIKGLRITARRNDN